MTRIKTIKLSNPAFKKMWDLDKLWSIEKNDDVIKNNDDVIKKNDVVIYMEANDKKGMSGNEILARVTDVLSEHPGLNDGYCIATIKVIERVQGHNTIGEW